MFRETTNAPTVVLATQVTTSLFTTSLRGGKEKVLTGKDRLGQLERKWWCPRRQRGRKIVLIRETVGHILVYSLRLATPETGHTCVEGQEHLDGRMDKRAG